MRYFERKGQKWISQTWIRDCLFDVKVLHFIKKFMIYKTLFSCKAKWSWSSPTESSLLYTWSFSACCQQLISKARKCCLHTVLNSWYKTFKYFTPNHAFHVAFKVHASRGVTAITSYIIPCIDFKLIRKILVLLRDKRSRCPFES